MGMEMEYNDDVIAKIREGQSPSEVEKETVDESRDDSKRVQPAGKYDKQARKDGWVPLDDWVEQGKDEEDWVDSGEFVRRGELMNRIKSQSKALKAAEKKQAEMDARLKAVTEHNAKIAKAEFEKAKKQLRAAKIEALEENNHEAVLDIDDKLMELEAQAKAAEEKPAKEAKEEQVIDNQLPAAVQDWLASDSSEWYRTDPMLQGAADKLAGQYANQNWDPAVPAEDQPWDEMFEHIEGQLRKRFPSAFGDVEEDFEEEEEVEEPRKPVARKRVSQVAEPGRSRAPAKARGKTKLTLNDLTPDERKAHDEFVVRSKVMTTADYLEQLEAVRDL